MVGGDGNDTYYVDESTDSITEGSGGSSGTDVVYASANYTMAANVENMVLDGNSPVNGTGNSGNNDILGNSAANLIDGDTGSDTMTGGGGSDTYVVNASGDSVVEDAGAGTDTVRLAAGMLAYTLGDNVERLDGSVDNSAVVGFTGVTLVGNALNNTLTGGAGADSLNGMAGTDIMIGGTGNDTYVADNSNDTVTEADSEGTDLVRSSVSFTLDANVENLTLIDGSGNINGIGNDLANVITGNDGNNNLDGGVDTTAADTLEGGAGDDTYVLGDGDDLSTTGDTGGTADLIKVGRTFDISASKYSGIENLTLTGTGNFNATGNSSANIITGNAGDNSITGGAGADTMIGSTGSDTYFVDDAGDKITETGTDVDQVFASVNYSLASQGLIENATLTGSAISLTGNTMANTLTGNASANVIDGGTGADTMVGGAGSDTYVVDNAGDKTTEAFSGSDFDVVQASVSYTIADDIEVLTLTGTSALSGTGNVGDNTINGNSGNNVLDGGAGGADTLVGGAGNDTYVLLGSNDVVTEVAGEGTNDRVQIGSSYTLADEVEELEFTGTGAANGTGNVLNNKMIGNTGANLLDGKGGNDTMTGGTGNDTYYVDSANDLVTELAAQGVDEVHSTVNYSLAGSFIEKLVLEGTSNLTATGSDNADTLNGNDGNNVINGGTGADTMAGGKGADTYVVENVADTVTEASDEGVDTVQSSITYSISALANLENMTLTGSANINATGNTGDNVLTGNSGNNSITGGAGNDTMVGGDGNDSYVVTDAGDVVTELSSPLGGIDQVTSNQSFTLGDYVETLILTGSSNLDATGGKYNNTLTGNSGNNVIDGKAGNDTMAGGGGSDTYYVDSSTDTVTDSAGAADVVNASASFTITAGIETFNLTGSANINATGNAEANTINGNVGNNVINGGALGDTMAGGAGNDTYYVDNSSDQVTEVAGEGVDTLYSYITYTLSSEVENMSLVGAGAVNATGNGLANVVNGNGAANIIDGGSAADTMNGGAGNDTYVVDNVGDKVIELTTTGGTDLVQSSVSFNLSGYFIENLTLTGTGVINGVGNALANTIAGNSAANIINGGTGADTMSGGDGNDTFIVDNVNDQVSEAASQGTDLVKAGVSYTITDADVENLMLTGAANINATGNASSNYLYGNDGMNILNGGGGGEADTMAGGNGNDVYVVDSTSDRVIELVGGGTDTVQSSTTWALATYVENITLTGSGNVNATGNASANVMTGNSGNNAISASDGNDTLTGGAGSDLFIFSSSGSANVDNVTDFNVAADTIQLSQSAFSALTQTGTIDTNDFFVVGSGIAANQHVYLSGSTLYYDADGYTNNTIAGVAIATFTSATVPALTYQDITVL